MSYIDLEQGKVPAPGNYNEYRYNESPKWSMRPRTSSESMDSVSKFSRRQR